MENIIILELAFAKMYSISLHNVLRFIYSLVIFAGFLEFYITTV